MHCQKPESNMLKLSGCSIGCVGSFLSNKVFNTCDDRLERTELTHRHALAHTLLHARE